MAAAAWPPPLADPVPPLLGIAPHPRPEGCIAAQQRRQRMHALNPKQGLQPIEQAILHNRHHRARPRRALDAFHQVEDSELPPAVEAVIQQGSCVQTLHAVDHALAVQAPCHSGIVPTSRLPTPAFRQVVWDRFPALSHRPPSSLACLSALGESGPAIQGFTYSGTSEVVSYKSFQNPP